MVGGLHTYYTCPHKSSIPSPISLPGKVHTPTPTLPKLDIPLLMPPSRMIKCNGSPLFRMDREEVWLSGERGRWDTFLLGILAQGGDLSRGLSRRRCPFPRGSHTPDGWTRRAGRRQERGGGHVGCFQGCLFIFGELDLWHGKRFFPPKPLLQFVR